MRKICTLILGMVSTAVLVPMLLLIRATTAPAPWPTVSLVQREIRDDSSCLRDAVHPGTQFRTRQPYKERLFWAFLDARDMAQQALDTSFIFSSAYSHYFVPGRELQVRRMFQAIVHAIEDTPANPVFHHDIKVRCGSDQNELCASPGRPPFAVVDTHPDGDITFCDWFFHPHDRRVSTRLGSAPFNRTGWCRPNQIWSDLQVAGVLVIREMTRLDALGRRAQRA